MVEEAISVRKTIIEIFNGMGMKLTKFGTNSSKFHASTPIGYRNPTKEMEFTPKRLKIQRVSLKQLK